MNVKFEAKHISGEQVLGARNIDSRQFMVNSKAEDPINKKIKLHITEGVLTRVSH